MAVATPIAEKKVRGRKKGYKVKKQAPEFQKGTPAVESPRTVTSEESLVRAVDERNPVLQVMAKEWERLEAVIQDARSKQGYLQELVEKAKSIIDRYEGGT